MKKIWYSAFLTNCIQVFVMGGYIGISRFHNNIISAFIATLELILESTQGKTTKKQKELKQIKKSEKQKTNTGKAMKCQDFIN